MNPWFGHFFYIQTLYLKGRRAWNSRINQFNVAHCQTLTTLCSTASHCCHKMNLTATFSRTPEAKTKQSVLLRKEKQVLWMFLHNSLHFFQSAPCLLFGSVCSTCIHKLQHVVIRGPSVTWALCVWLWSCGEDATAQHAIQTSTTPADCQCAACHCSLPRCCFPVLEGRERAASTRRTW